MVHTMARSEVATETPRQVDGGGDYITWPGHVLTETGFAGNRGPNSNPISKQSVFPLTLGDI